MSDVTTTAPAASPKSMPVRTKPAEPKFLHVLDTTAVRTDSNPEGKRVHQQVMHDTVKSYTFEPGKPLPLAPEIALKFLRHDAFKLTDENGNVKEYKRRPKQPGELEAGEIITLADDQTIANYEELTTTALRNRVLEMPGGEQFANNPSRQAIIDFIVFHMVKVKKQNTSRQKDIDDDAFVPTEEFEEEAA